MNIQSINKKLNILEVELNKINKPAFICISESWLRDSEVGSVSLEGYRLISHSSRTILRGGGTAIWAIEGLEAYPVNFNELNAEKDFEFCVCESKINNVLYKIITLYRSPTGNFQVFLDKFLQLLNSIFTIDSHIWITGDFNINFNIFSPESEEITNITAQYGLHSIVHENTRSTSHSNTKIDNIFANVDARAYVSDTYLSDHRMIIVPDDAGVLQPHLTKKNFKFCRTYNKNNKKLFEQLLKNETWKEVYDAEDINNKYEAFIGTLLSHFNRAFPIKKKFERSTEKTWVSDEIKFSSTQLKDLHKLQRHYPNLQPIYKERKREHKILVENNRKKHYEKIIQNSANKSKSSWAIINKLRNKNNTTLSNLEILHNGETIQSPVQIANIFNEFFINAPKSVIQNITPVGDNHFTDPLISNPHTLLLLPFSEEEMLKIFSKLKNKYSTGPDDLPTKIIKEFCSELLAPITHLINLSFECGTVPEGLKVAKVIPVHKKNSKNHVDNYRPISLTSAISKIFEYCMLERLNSFIERYCLIPKEQHGFRRNKSTTTATTEFYMYILNELDKKRCPVGVYCDLSKAFDCVSHPRLLHKLWVLGIRGSAHDWFKSYLSNRKQYIEVSHNEGNGSSSRHCSDTVNVEVGVPQGSILAPILFSLYVADIAKHISDYKITMYADDLSILISRESHELNQDACNNLMKKIEQWFSKNVLYLNSSKTEYLLFHTRQKQVQNINISIGKTNIERSSIVKFLGVTMTDTLEWTSHIECIIKKLNSKIYQLRCIRCLLNIEVLKNFYFAEVQSSLLYGIMLWGASPAAKKLFLIQKRCIRVMLNKRQSESCRQLFAYLNILPVCCLYILEVACHIFRNKHNLQCHRDIHNHDTRNGASLCTPQNSLNITLKGPLSNGIRIYNKIPTNIKEQPTYFRFKKTLKNHLKNGLYYNLDEFFL